LNFKEILELIDKVADRGIAGIEIEQAGTKLRIEGKHAQPHVFASYVGGEMKGETPVLPSIPITALPAAASAPAEPSKPDEKKKAGPVEGQHVITSPIVGTFYRSANPETPPFINVGDKVSKGKVLCIIEAMKLMNEIESDVDGTIVEIYPQNGQPVEFGEPLFAVKA